MADRKGKIILSESPSFSTWDSNKNVSASLTPESSTLVYICINSRVSCFLNGRNFKLFKAKIIQVLVRKTIITRVQESKDCEK